MVFVDLDLNRVQQMRFAQTGRSVNEQRIVSAGRVCRNRLRRRVVEDISAFGTQTLGLELLGVEESPIRGREKGNIEYLAWWRKPAENAIIPPPK